MEQIALNNAATACPGAWLLPAHTALTLRPASPGRLRVCEGALWATLDGPHGGAANDRGDRILQPGDVLSLRAGERLVIERLRSATPARFTWDPAPAQAHASPPAGAPTHHMKENRVRRFRDAPTFDLLGWATPAPLARVLLALLAFGLSATLWAAAAAVSGGHRLEAQGVSAVPQQHELRTAGCTAPGPGRAPA
jgi:hypothetical protein